MAEPGDVAEARAAWHAHVLLVTSAAGAPVSNEEVWRDTHAGVRAVRGRVSRYPTLAALADQLAATVRELAEETGCATNRWRELTVIEAANAATNHLV